VYLLWGESGRRSSRAIQAVQLAPIPDESEKVSAHIAANWLDDGQCNCGSQGSIHGISSLLESRKPCLCRQWLARCDNAIGSKKRLSPECWPGESGKIEVHLISSGKRQLSPGYKPEFSFCLLAVASQLSLARDGEHASIYISSWKIALTNRSGSWRTRLSFSRFR
jgi:hypothetical protein